MIDKDNNILTTVYNYIKLVKPEEEISLIEFDVIKYIFINGPLMEFMNIYCNDKKLVTQTTDVMKVPSWFKELFHLERISGTEAAHVIPRYKLGGFYKYYRIEVKDKELLK